MNLIASKGRAGFLHEDGEQEDAGGWTKVGCLGELKKVGHSGGSIGQGKGLLGWCWASAEQRSKVRRRMPTFKPQRILFSLCRLVSQASFRQARGQTIIATYALTPHTSNPEDPERHPP